MLGSAIPKRWVVSLALVGLVSLFMASYSAVWVNPAAADGGDTTGTVLMDLQAPTSLNLSTGQVVELSVLTIDYEGNQNLNLPNVVYTWNTSGGCGSMTAGSTSRTPTFTADSGPCSGSIIVHARQGEGANVPTDGRTISVSISAPPAAPAPTAVPVNPTSILVQPPPGYGANDIDVITPVDGGIASGAIGDGLFVALLSVPEGALDSNTVAAVQMFAILTEDVPAPPPPAATEGSSSGTFTFGSAIIDVQWYDQTGSAFDTFRLNRPAQICMPFNVDDLAGASGGPDGLGIWRYNGSEWIPLASSVDTFNNTVCANTSNFSVFALGLAVAPPSDDVVVPEATVAPVTGLPVTGDYTPGVGALVLAMLAGIALIATGAFTARRARRVRSRS